MGLRRTIRHMPASGHDLTNDEAARAGRRLKRRAVIRPEVPDQLVMLVVLKRQKAYLPIELHHLGRPGAYRFSIHRVASRASFS